MKEGYKKKTAEDKRKRVHGEQGTGKVRSRTKKTFLCEINEASKKNR